MGSASGNLLVREFRHMLPPTIFFLIAFNIIAMTAILMARTGNDTITFATASFAALICGKAVLLADKLPFFNRFPDRPLMWNAAWKAALYTLVTAVIRLAEHLLRAATGDYGFAVGVEHALSELSWQRFVVIQLWLAVLFLSYSVFSELLWVLGRDRMRRLLFGPLLPGDIPARDMPRD